MEFDYKLLAKVKLNGKLGLIFLHSLLVGITLGISMIPLFIPFIILLPPFIYGFNNTIYKIYKSEYVPLFDFVSVGFANFKKSWELFIRKSIKLLIPFLILAISTRLTTYVFSLIQKIEYEQSFNNWYLNNDTYDYDNSDYDHDYSYDSIDYTDNNIKDDNLEYKETDIQSDKSLENKKIKYTILLIILIIVEILAYILYISKSYYYILAYYVAFDNPNASANYALLKSYKLMLGNRLKFFFIELYFVIFAIVIAVLSFLCIYFSILLLVSVPIMIKIMLFIISIADSIFSFWLSQYRFFSSITFYEALSNPELYEKSNIARKPRLHYNNFNNTTNYDSDYNFNNVYIHQSKTSLLDETSSSDSTFNETNSNNTESLESFDTFDTFDTSDTDSNE